MTVCGLLAGAPFFSPVSGPFNIQTDIHCFTYEFQLQIESKNMAAASCKEQPQLMIIDELIGAIDEKNRSLMNLLKEKSKVLDRIQTQLDFRAYARKPFNSAQLDSFIRFTGFYNREAGALQNALRKINADKELIAAKKELLHREANYTAIIDELTSFNNCLSDAIDYLRDIVDFGNITLRAL